MFVTFLNESIPLGSKQEFLPFLKRLMASRGIPNGIPEGLKDSATEDEFYLLGVLPNGRRSRSWFFRWNEDRTVGAGVVVALSAELVRDVADRTKYHAYIYARRVWFQVLMDRKYIRVLPGKYIGSVHGDDIQSCLHSKDAMDLTKRIDRDMRNYSSLPFKKLENVYESSGLEEAAVLTPNAKISEVVADLKKKGYKQNYVLDLLKTLETNNRKVFTYMNIYLPDGTMGKWFLHGDYLVISCSIVSYNYVHPGIAAFKVDEETKKVYHVYSICLTPHELTVKHFMEKTTETKKLSAIAQKELRKLSVLSAPDLYQALYDLKKAEDKR